jgi:hypothetical protein
VKECTPAAALLAIPLSSLLPVELLRRLWGPVCEIVRLICQFRGSDPTPRRVCDFERQLCELLRKVGRVIVEWVYRDCEPQARDLLPTQIQSAFDVASHDQKVRIFLYRKAFESPTAA